MDVSLDIRRMEGSSTVILVGKNETGKSNLLQAIGFLAEPKGEYNYQVLKNAQNDNCDAINFYYTFYFKTENEWRKILESKINAPKEFFEKLILRGVEKNLYLTSDSNQFKTRHTFIFENDNNFFNKFCYRTINHSSLLYDVAYEKDISKIETDINEYKNFTSTEFNKFLDNVFSDFMNQQGSVNVAKWKYSKEYLITDIIDLNEFKENCEICHPLKNIFNLAGYKTQSDIKNKIDSLMLGPKNINKLEKILENAAKEHLNIVWPECRVLFKIKIQDDLKLAVYVVDENDEENTFYLTDRSEGFKQFISFIMGVSAANATKNLRDRVIIIDEPETHMHPSGIKYMRDELLRIGRNNYVFIATHSEFIIDTKNKERHYIVTKVNNNTSVQNWNSNSSIPNDEILRQAFGLNILSDILEKYELPTDINPETYMYNMALKVLYPTETPMVKENVQSEIIQEEKENNLKDRSFRKKFITATKRIVKDISQSGVLEIFSKR